MLLIAGIHTSNVVRMNSQSPQIRSNQQIFDIVVAHLQLQVFTSITPGSESKCAYRGKDNRKCAVGVLINDSDYNTMIEGKPVNSGAVIYMLTLARIPTDKYTLRLLDRLQRLHDTVMPRDTHDQTTILARLKEADYQFKLIASDCGVIYVVSPWNYQPNNLPNNIS